MNRVITYQAPSGGTINLTPRQVAILKKAGNWPKDYRGQEYCSVSHGLHDGEPTGTVVETMPDQHRGSHRAAGNWGTYPSNGAERHWYPHEEAEGVLMDQDGYNHEVK